MSTTQNFTKPEALIQAERAADTASTTESLTKSVTDYARQIDAYKAKGRHLAALHAELSEFAAKWAGIPGYDQLTSALEEIAYQGRRVREDLASTRRYHVRAQESLSAHLATVAGSPDPEADEFA